MMVLSLLFLNTHCSYNTETRDIMINYFLFLCILKPFELLLNDT